MNKLIFSLTLCLFTAAAFAGSPKITTLVSRPDPLGTNATLLIPSGQAAKVLSSAGDEVKFIKGGITFRANRNGAIVEGPVTIILPLGIGSSGAYATIERWRVPQNLPSPVGAFQTSGKVQTLVSYPSTNATLQIPAGQAAKIASFFYPTVDPSGGVAIFKDGVRIEAVDSAGTPSGVVEGPASIEVWVGGSGATGAMATIERWRIPKVVPLLPTK